MSHLLDTTTDRLAVPGHPDLWVEFKREASFAEDLELEYKRGEILARAPRDAQSGLRQPDAQLITEFVIVRAAAMVAAWNLTDARGEPLPLGFDSIIKLKGDIIEFLGDESARRLLGRPEAKEAPFVKRSRRSSRQGS